MSSVIIWNTPVVWPENVEREMRAIFNVAPEKEVKLWNKYMSNTYELLKKLDTSLQDLGFYPGHVIVLEERNADGTWPRQTKQYVEDSLVSTDALIMCLWSLTLSFFSMCL